MITHPAYMQLYILCKIKYHDQYKCSNKLCLITYHILVTDLFFLIEVFTLAIIILSITIFSLFINSIQKHEYEFRFFLLPWVTEILDFYWHWKPCYYHNTDFRQHISIYRKYFFRISVIFRIPMTLIFFLGYV